MRSPHVRPRIVQVKHGFAFGGEHLLDEPTSHVLVTPGNLRLAAAFKTPSWKFYRGPVPEEYVLQAT